MFQALGIGNRVAEVENEVAGGTYERQGPCRLARLGFKCCKELPEGELQPEACRLDHEAGKHQNLHLASHRHGLLRASTDVEDSSRARAMAHHSRPQKAEKGSHYLRTRGPAMLGSKRLQYPLIKTIP